MSRSIQVGEDVLSIQAVTVGVFDGKRDVMYRIGFEGEAGLSIFESELPYLSQLISEISERDVQ